MLPRHSSGLWFWFKRQVELAQGLAFIIGVISALSLGLVSMTGGHIPPWVTIADAQEQAGKAAAIQRDTAKILERLNTKVDQFGRRLDQQDCSALNRSYQQAQAVLAAKPEDPMAKMLRDNTRAQMRAIPGCTPD